MKILFIALSVFATSGFAQCKPITWDADKKSDSKVIVNGKINRAHTSLVVNIYHRRELIGKNSAVSNQFGDFSTEVFTHSPAGMRPDTIITCR